jgi:hypothetical protein
MRIIFTSAPGTRQTGATIIYPASFRPVSEIFSLLLLLHGPW